MRRHLDDVFVKGAVRQGWRSRAVFKLEEIDARERLLKPGMRVVDLGAAPGAWSQYAARRVGSRGTVIALDLLPLEPLPGVRSIQGDFADPEVLASLERVLGEQPVDLVISDMAPNLSGVRAVDQPAMMNLAELAFEFACERLAPEGSFLVKVFQGEGFDAYLGALKERFRTVKVLKPAASRAASRETYLLARYPRMV
jgi:23S rRNA (uridine2552-2'-O)-methyltransferase